MKAERAAEHIPISVLWGGRKGIFSLSSADRRHVLDCGACIRLRGICEIAKSLEDANRLANEELGH